MKGDLNGNFGVKLLARGIFLKSNPKQNYVCRILSGVYFAENLHFIEFKMKALKKKILSHTIMKLFEISFRIEIDSLYIHQYHFYFCRSRREKYDWIISLTHHTWIWTRKSDKMFCFHRNSIFSKKNFFPSILYINLICLTRTAVLHFIWVNKIDIFALQLIFSFTSSFTWIFFHSKFVFHRDCRQDFLEKLLPCFSQLLLSTFWTQNSTSVCVL